MNTADITVDEMLRVAKELHGKFPPSEVLVEVRMNSGTFDFLTRTIPVANGPLSLFDTPVMVMDEMPDREYRMLFADGSQRIVIDGMEVAMIPPTKRG